jgi:hypothetical protein
MTALTKLIKAFGVNVEEKHIEAIEKIIPEVPRIVEQGISLINGAVTNFDARLCALETAAENNRINQSLIIEHQVKIREELQEILTHVRTRRDSDSRTSATGNSSGNDNGKHRSDTRSSNRRR